MTPSVAAPSDTNPSDATVATSFIANLCVDNILFISHFVVYDVAIRLGADMEYDLDNGKV